MNYMHKWVIFMSKHMANNNGGFLSNNTYDVLKWIAQILLPSLGTLYFTLSSLWNLPFTNEVIGTITAIDTFLGFLLERSSATYKGDGVMLVDRSSDDVDVYRMELNGPVEDLGEKDSVMFKVKNVN